jgi:hypothetical protein
MVAMHGSVEGRYLYEPDCLRLRMYLQRLTGVMIMHNWEQLAPYIVTAD